MLGRSLGHSMTSRDTSPCRILRHSENAELIRYLRSPVVRQGDTISHFLSPKAQPPTMLLDRTDEDDALTLPSSKTRLLGFDGIILEATESTQVVSVMLF
ncbi:uncharacterized protein C8Q71DRAFT_36979 [Rhodofomes roseus]|uniref:Uncharacterized protein n=1 Tax=Rhodofomes roseus TaxID=34475 RepID=A0ABQ8L133_9APHY|nr:uncharacterized protein C8Q71DRAFT_36979 [Rhodofomes roseus]KAH9844252.1 hypothetical protein C8Q71DRAFT_36979 [Rhodofomes roseus]